MKTRCPIAGLVLLLAGGLTARADYMAIQVPSASGGNQSGYTIGEDFQVLDTTGIVLSDLAAYDAGSDGFTNPISVRIYNTTTGIVVPGTSFDIGSGNSTRAAGSAFSFLNTYTPVTLLPGTYRLVAFNFTAADPEYNTNGGSTPNTDTGGGLISFDPTSATGNSYYDGIVGAGDTYPTSRDNGINRYYMASFTYVEALPEPSCVGLFCLAGWCLMRRRNRSIAAE